MTIDATRLAKNLRELADKIENGSLQCVDGTCSIEFDPQLIDTRTVDEPWRFITGPDVLRFKADLTLQRPR